MRALSKKGFTAAVLCGSLSLFTASTGVAIAADEDTAAAAQPADASPAAAEENAPAAGNDTDSEKPAPEQPAADAEQPANSPEESAPESPAPSKPADTATQEKETSKPATPSASTTAPQDPRVVVQVINNATNVTEVKDGNTITKISEPGKPEVIVVTQDDKGNVIRTHREDAEGKLIPGSEKKPGDKGFEESIPVDKMPEDLIKKCCANKDEKPEAKPCETNKPEDSEEKKPCEEKTSEAKPSEEKKAEETTTEKKPAEKVKKAKPKATPSSTNDNKPNVAQKHSEKQVGPRVVTGGSLA